MGKSVLSSGILRNHMHRIIRAFALLALCVIPSRAQEPASRPADLSNPREALKTLVDALKTGDVKTAQRVCQAKDPQIKKLVNVGLAWQAAVEKLVATCEKKFGDGMGAPLRAKLEETGPADFVPSVEKNLEQAPESDSGESVSINMGENQPVLELVRVDGEWKIDSDKALAQMEPQRRQQMIREWPKSTKKMKDAAKGVEEGKLASVDDVEAAIEPGGPANAGKQ